MSCCPSLAEGSQIDNQLIPLVLSDMISLGAAITAMTKSALDVAPQMGWPYFKQLTHWHLIANVLVQLAVSHQTMRYYLYEVKHNAGSSDVLKQRDIVWRPKLLGSELVVNPRNFVLTSSVLIAGLYWSLLAKSFQWEEFLYHGAFASISLLGLIINNIPYAAKEAHPTLVFNLIYAVFAAAYSLGGGFTYPQLQWDKHPLKAAIFSVGGLVGVYATAYLLGLMKAGLRCVGEYIDRQLDQTDTVREVEERSIFRQAWHGPTERSHRSSPGGVV